MATFDFTIPDALVPRVVDAYCDTFMYDDNKQVDETRAQFTRRMIVSGLRDDIKKVVRNHILNAKQIEVQAKWDEGEAEAATFDETQIS